MSSRASQKQAARVVREQLARERRRRRTMWTSVVAVAALVIAGLVGWGVWKSQQPETFTAPATATSDRNGLVVGNGPVKVDIYLDYMCPACHQFEDAAAPTLDKWIAEKKITLVYHPISILDRFSNGTQYSTRSASSAGCAADGGKLNEYTKALFVKQPAEGSDGLSDDELIQIGGSVGLVDPAFAKCVRDQKYGDWVGHVTDQAAKRGVQGTPTVFVEGKEVQATLPALTAAVEGAAK